MQEVIVATDKKELLDSIHEPISGMLDLMSQLDNKKINTVPCLCQSFNCSFCYGICYVVTHFP